MLEFAATKDWKRAFLNHLPSRKGLTDLGVGVGGAASGAQFKDYSPTGAGYGAAARATVAAAAAAAAAPKSEVGGAESAE